MKQKIVLLGSFMLIALIIGNASFTAAQTSFLDYKYATDKTEFEYKVKTLKGENSSEMPFVEGDVVRFQLSESLEGMTFFDIPADFNVTSYINDEEVTNQEDSGLLFVIFIFIVVTPVDSDSGNYFDAVAAESGSGWTVEGDKAIFDISDDNGEGQMTYEKDTGVLISWEYKSNDGNDEFVFTQNTGLFNSLPFNYSFFLIALLAIPIIRRKKLSEKK